MESQLPTKTKTDVPKQQREKFKSNDKFNNKEFKEFKNIVANIRNKLKEAKQSLKDKTDEFKKSNFIKK